MYVPLNKDRNQYGAYGINIGAGAAYGTAKSGIGIAGVGTFRPDLIMKVRETLPGRHGVRTRNDG